MNKSKLISEAIIRTRKAFFTLEDVSCALEDLSDDDGKRICDKAMMSVDLILGHLEKKAELNTNNGKFAVTLAEFHAERKRKNGNK